MPDADDVLMQLRSLADADNVAGMARYGIATAGTLGVSIPNLRALAKELRPMRKSDPEGLHALAGALWDSGLHEARILAGLADVPSLVTPEQADRWVADLDSWDVCDQLCSNLLDKTPFAVAKAEEWALAEPEFVRRAGFAMMAALTVHNKTAGDETFQRFLTLIERAADDERNFVKKAVNWALRQIGKRNAALNAAALATARRLRDSESRAARWIAADAIRELESEAVRTRLGV